MSGELFEEFDEIVAWGNPIHGYREASGGALKSESGVTINLSGLVNELPPDGWNRVSDFGMPGITTTAEDLAAGLTWKNFVVWSGRSRRYMPIHGGALGPMDVGELAWPYQTADGTIWFLWVTLASYGTIDIRASLQPIYSGPPGAGGTLVAQFANPENTLDHVFVNFSLNGSLAALHLCAANMTFDGALEAVYIYDITVSGGSATNAPAVSVSLTYDPSNMTHIIDAREFTPELKKVDVSTEEFYWSNDDPYPGSGHCPRVTVGTADGENSNVVGIRRDINVLAIVFDGDGHRRVLSHESWSDTNFMLTASYTGYYDLAPDPGFELGNWTVFEYTSTGYQRIERRLCLDGFPAVTVLVSEVDSYVDAVETGNGAAGGVTTVINDSRDERTLPFVLSNPTLVCLLANGEIGIVVESETVGSAQLVAYLGPRHGAQFSYGSFPDVSDLSGFATHPISGVFDPAVDRYF